MQDNINKVKIGEELTICVKELERLARYREPVTVSGDVVKPPLGIMPKKIWIEERIEGLNEAIERYKATENINWDCINKWEAEINELNQLIPPEPVEVTKEEAFKGILDGKKVKKVINYESGDKNEIIWSLDNLKNRVEEDYYDAQYYILD